MLGSKLAASRAGGPAFRQGEGAMRCGEARMLAADVRFVIRYDHRDTGRSVTYPSRRPWIHGRRPLPGGLLPRASAHPRPVLGHNSRLAWLPWNWRRNDVWQGK